mgnify:CR=1 FL=1
MGKTQKTPQGHEIPVPTKDDVFKVLEKAADGVWFAREERYDDVAQLTQVLTCPAELECQPQWCLFLNQAWVAYSRSICLPMKTADA